MRSSPWEVVEGAVRSVGLLLYPSQCGLCGKLLEKRGERVICRECLESVQPDPRSYCLCCGRFFEMTGAPHLCSGCLKRRPPYSLHRSYGRYDGALKNIILLFKYGKREILGKDLAEHIARAPGPTAEVWAGVDLVIPVPLHSRRKKERGFNQSEVLAHRLSSKRGVKVAARILVKIENTPPQTSLEAMARKTSVRGAYRVRNGDRLWGKTVLLVDDVLTTGATLGECSRTLLRAGASEVRALTVARA